VVAGALVEAGFVLEVTAIEAIEEDFEVRRWSVKTRQGPRRFQTALDAWPRPASDSGILIEDVAGDLFRVPPVDELDPRSRKLIWAFVD
jgi:glycine/D-amino acid oxidase-like deaminating enzyme